MQVWGTIAIIFGGLGVAGFISNSITQGFVSQLTFLKLSWQVINLYLIYWGLNKWRSP